MWNLLFWNDWVPIHKLYAGSYCFLDKYLLVTNSAFRHVIWIQIWSQPGAGSEFGSELETDPDPINSGMRDGACLLLGPDPASARYRIQSSGCKLF
jgi:hypothetical protein